MVASICQFALQIFHCFVDCRNPLTNLYSLSLYKCNILFCLPYSLVALPKILSEACFFISGMQFHHLMQCCASNHVRGSFGSSLMSGRLFYVLHQENFVPLPLKNWQHSQFLEAALCLLPGKIKGTVQSTVEHLTASFMQLSFQGEFSYEIIDCSLSGSTLDGSH